ncbi:unnamed protein product [Mytilus edulis]|uniref:B box-type domain-containing protein n=1 Tax=Mytilus edulis TaxID=6550 RepID=A0A8S3VFN5_MYTED|nr:unnamed protein product [Mytilus edulis]
MASTNTVICGVCESQHTTTNADYWCPECDEGLCSPCLKHHSASKSSRNHEVISVDNYKQLPPSITNISQHCQQHDRKFQNYCPQHESVCCPLCIQSNHAECVGILSLENVIQTAKTSVLLESLDQNLKDIKINIERVVKDRKQNVIEIQKQGQKFHDEIKQVRKNINEHLDNLEQQILQDLYAAETKVKSQTEDLLGKLDDNAENVNSMENNILTIKDNASDLQTFLWSKMIESEIKKMKYSCSLYTTMKVCGRWT